MTEAATEAVDPAKVDAAFEAVKAACTLRGIEVARLDSPAPNRVGVELKGVTRKWSVYIDCDEEQLRLPAVWTDAPTSGSICFR